MPKRAQHDERRAKLLEKCGTVFLEKGYAAVSMRKLSAATGASVGRLYHYFGSKEELFRELIIQHLEQFRPPALQVLLSANVSQEGIFSFFQQNLALDEQMLARFFVLVDYIRTVGVETFHKEVDFRSKQDELAKLLADLLRIPLEKAQVLQVFLLGMAFHHFLRGSNDTLENEVNQLLKFLYLPL